MKHKRAGIYSRICSQLMELFRNNRDLHARMATMNAILYHKMDGFSWVGFYLLHDGRLTVGAYQGLLACMELPKDTGVCWAGINGKKTIVVPDVHAFPGHIDCDPRSRSEIVIPLTDKTGTIIGVMDIDSILESNFDDSDAPELERIVSLLFV